MEAPVRYLEPLFRENDMNLIERKASMLKKSLEHRATSSIVEAIEKAQCEDEVSHFDEDTGVVVMSDDGNTAKLERRETLEGVSWEVE